MSDAPNQRSPDPDDHDPILDPAPPIPGARRLNLPQTLPLPAFMGLAETPGMRAARHGYRLVSAIMHTLGRARVDFDELSLERRRAYERAAWNILFHRAGTPEQRHEMWRAARIAEGWTSGRGGPVLRQSEELVPYAELPPYIRAQEVVFRAAVLSFVEELSAPKIGGIAPEPVSRLTFAETELNNARRAFLRAKKWVEIQRDVWVQAEGREDTYLTTEAVLLQKIIDCDDPPPQALEKALELLRDDGLEVDQAKIRRLFGIPDPEPATARPLPQESGVPATALERKCACPGVPEVRPGMAVVRCVVCSGVRPAVGGS